MVLLFVSECFFMYIYFFLSRFIMELSIGDELAVVTYGAAARQGA